MFARGALGYSMIELAVAVGLIATATATALPRMLAGFDESRVAGAARYLSARFYDTRIEAVTRSEPWAERFPGMFRITDGTMETGLLTGPGLGAV